MAGILSKDGVKPPILSILLPTFNYKEGVTRILSGLEGLLNLDVEVIIGDNSTNQLVKDGIAPFLNKYSSKVTYQWNNPTKSPIQNWNWLINAARGEYLMMIHHDEYFVGEKSLLDMVHMLKADSSIDVILLNCYLVYQKRRLTFNHFSSSLRSFLIRKNPAYLYRRNLIGPTATVVARKTCYPFFDENLIWLVDVDMYVRLFNQGVKWVASPGVIYSEQERSNSLTKGLGASIPSLRVSELSYLRSRDKAGGVWLGPYMGEPLSYKFWRILECSLWYPYRMVTKGAALIFGKS